MLVGFGRACITPEESVPLAGMGNTSKRIPGEEKAYEHDAYGYVLADYAMEALENLQPIADGPVKLLSDAFVALLEKLK